MSAASSTPLLDRTSTPRDLRALEDNQLPQLAEELRQGEPGVSEFAWYDMAVALRAPFIGYLLCAGAHEGVLSEQEATALHDESARYLPEIFSLETTEFDR